MLGIREDINYLVYMPKIDEVHVHCGAAQRVPGPDQSFRPSITHSGWYRALI